jgi:hypothetical protein
MTNAIKRAGRAAMWEVMKDRSPRTPAQAATAGNSRRTRRPLLSPAMLANDKLLKINTETGKFKTTMNAKARH